MRHLTLITLSILTTLTHLSAQTPEKSPSGFCETKGCPIKNDESHFDPYYNGHLCENFDPKQSDFSAEYLKLRSRDANKNIVSDLAGFDLSSIWPTPDGQQNGVIGLDYKRIRINIGSVTKDPMNNLLYHVEGKSNVNGNICDFKGEIKFLKAHEFKAGSESDHENSGRLFAEYTFYEDKAQKGSGLFKGIHECFYYLDKKNNMVLLDESSDIADGYFNRTFVGTWTSYNTKAVKKCIWGDYRLPFTFDFDCGDGEMMACAKYVQNGWQAFNSQKEYDIIDSKFILKDKWWQK